MSFSIIIPAFNEEKTVADVVRVAVESNIFVDIIVVDDGSSDKTAEFAKAAGAMVVQLSKNAGKGEAIRQGLEVVTKSVGVILLWDADLIGTRRQDFQDVVFPVESNNADMVIGVIPSLGQKLAPTMSGLRAIPTGYLRQFFAWLKVQGIQNVRFSFEIRLNDWFCNHVTNKVLIGNIAGHDGHQLAITDNSRLRQVWLPGITHLTKLQKLGLWRGLWAWMVMWKQIILGE